MDYPGKVITKTQVTPTQTSASGNWTLDDQAAAIKNNNWPVALVPNPIFKSLRFNSADSTYLNRTPASAGNRKTWTFSCWVKKATTGSFLELFSASPSGGGVDQFLFGSGDTLNYYFSDGTVRFNVVTASVYRDPSAWYHVVLAVDTTQATSTNRAKIYVNGTEASLTTGLTYAPQNQDTYINNSNLTAIGSQINGGSNNGLYLNGYLTETNFIDGQALTPSSFGMTNPQTGQWIPKKYTGTYGTNGFYLNFKDATSTTTLGYDYSGNANNWTTNNFSVTAGAGNDSLTDVPTPWVAYNTTGDVGGVIRGNYCTLNPLNNPGSSTISNGNLDVVTASGTAGRVVGTFGVSSGKWYWEIVGTSIISGESSIGIAAASTSSSALLGNETTSYAYYSDGNKRTNSSFSAYGASYTNNDVIGVALDLDAGTLTFYKNNSSQGTAFSSISGTFVPALSDGSSSNSSTFVCNFGQRPFAYTPPAGFRSLCTTNLPATTIGFGLTNQANKYFDATLYTGNGSTTTVTNSGSMQPDLVWVKNRTTAQNHVLVDVLRGNTNGLFSNLTDAAFSDGGFPTITSTGFSVGNSSWTNQNGSAFVGWQWKAGGTGVTNTAGTITSTVSANTTAGFSVVTWTGNGGSSETVGTGLSTTSPLAMAIVKRRSGTSDWWVGHQGILGQNFAYRVLLNSTAANSGSSPYVLGTQSSTNGDRLYLSTDGAANTVTYVAYCFQQVPGYSAFGSYTGNGSADGPFVYCGFRPEFVMIKNASATGDWFIYDAVRNTYNVADNRLKPNLADAEGTGGSYGPDILSNGFKMRSNFGEMNGSGNTIIYACFAEYPFQFANAR